MRKPIGLCLLPLAALLAASMASSPVLAAPSPPASKSSPAKQDLSKQDKKWLKGAHQINLTEIKAGRLAQRRAHADTLRRAGQTLVNDHRMLDQKLTRQASKLGLPLPTKPSVKQQGVLSLLSSKQNLAFDQAWVHQEIVGHLGAINKTKKEMHKGSSAAVKQLAKQTLPVLEKHLHLLRTAAGRMHGGG